MKKAIFLLVLVLFAGILTFAQEDSPLTDSREVPPAPVVSGLTAICKDNIVTLSWIQAPNIDGHSIVFRSINPITAANYAAAEKRGTVSCTTTTFSEKINDGESYYYAVLSRDSNGILYEFFLPVSNSLLVAVSTESVNISVPESFISSFDTITRNDAVIITWKSTLANKKLVLYRSTSPFTGMNSLLQAIVVSSFSDTGTPYVDYPVPGVPYYYSILDEDAIRIGSVKFINGNNTNRIPVEIPSIFAKIQRTNLPSLRPMPLPFLNPSQNVSVSYRQVSEETEKMIQVLGSLQVIKKEIIHFPFIFQSDIESVSGGEEFSLRKIVETNFSAKKWNDAISALSQFLSIRRTEGTTARAHFYLGEAYYFLGNYRQALLEFLLAQDFYYNQSREWIRYTLEKIP